MFPLRFRIHMWVTHTLRYPTQLVPWRPHGTTQLCATLHKGQGAQYHALSRDIPIPDSFGPLSLALAPCWDTVPLRLRYSPGGNSHPLVPYHQVSSRLLSLCPPRHSEGQGAQSCSGQYSLALACAKRGAQGPLSRAFTSVLHCLALTPQLPRSWFSLMMWVGGSRKTNWTVAALRCCTI